MPGEDNKTNIDKSLQQQKLWENELKSLVLEIREAILKHDVKRLLSYIDGDGLICTDTQVPSAEIENNLKDKSSKLYLSLFESERFAKECADKYSAEYPPISEREFFMKVVDPKMKVSFTGQSWARVTISSPLPQHYPREWLFHRTNGKWRLSSGFISRGCSCG